VDFLRQAIEESRTDSHRESARLLFGHSGEPATQEENPTPAVADFEGGVRGVLVGPAAGPDTVLREGLKRLWRTRGNL